MERPDEFQQYVDQEAESNRRAKEAQARRESDRVWWDNLRIIRSGAKKACAIMTGAELGAAGYLAVSGDLIGGTALGILGAVTGAIGLVL